MARRMLASTHAETETAPACLEDNALAPSSPLGDGGCAFGRRGHGGRADFSRGPEAVRGGAARAAAPGSRSPWLGGHGGGGVRLVRRPLRLQRTGRAGAHRAPDLQRAL